MDIGRIGALALAIVAWLAIVPLILSLAYPGSVNDTVKRSHVQWPAPRLQIDEQADLGPYRREEEAKLGSYGWVDRAKGIVRIPIEEAMARLARDGISGWPEARP
ncbi:MAG: hypothetical protein JO010_13305 [Alphaproteobacteria bacterium]|nr:hypothetical protein [Alphaproteobacteria bacterium]